MARRAADRRAIGGSGGHHVDMCVVREPDVHRDLHSFPTRRSSDLEQLLVQAVRRECELRLELLERQLESDRKSTRLNSSHGSISYAVFCLKKQRRSMAAGGHRMKACAWRWRASVLIGALPGLASAT